MRNTQSVCTQWRGRSILHLIEANCIRAFTGEIESIRDRVKKIKEDHAQAVRVLIYHTPITDASIEELVNWLAEVVVEMASLIMPIKDHMEDLVDDLKSFTAFLKKALKSDNTKDDENTFCTVSGKW